MVEIELEKTYLVKEIPKDLINFSYKEIIDIYIPKNTHPVLRLRKKGDSFEITKKQPLRDGDSSAQEEHTIKLSEEEFNSLAKTEGKSVRKIRYNYVYKGISSEIDVFHGDLAGLVLVDFEFKNVADKNKFVMPDFCLADVTQEKIFAGGMLCGKRYEDIEVKLEKFGYKALKV